MYFIGSPRRKLKRNVLPSSTTIETTVLPANDETGNHEVIVQANIDEIINSTETTALSANDEIVNREEIVQTSIGDIINSTNTTISSANDDIGNREKKLQTNSIDDITNSKCVYDIADSTAASSSIESNTENMVLDKTQELLNIPLISEIGLQCNMYESMFNPNEDISDFIRNDRELSSWTRISSYNIFDGIKDTLELTLSANFIKFDWDLDRLIILVFIKFKLNLSFVTIATLFRKNEHTISKYFYFILPYLKSALSSAIYWPTKEEILGNMPKCFEPFRSTRVVLDCFELKMPTLKCLSCRILTYSHYKGCQTVKFLVGVTPAGMISFISKPYGGRSSDKLIFNEEKLLSKYEFIPTADSIMVDKGFFIETECRNVGVKLIRPPFLRKVEQLSKEDAATNVVIAKARVHVERAIQRIRVFKIMTEKIEYNMLPWIEDIAFVVACVVNLSAPILADERF